MSPIGRNLMTVRECPGFEEEPDFLSCIQLSSGREQYTRLVLTL
jgi:hypothetical protein